MTSGDRRRAGETVMAWAEVRTGWLGSPPRSPRRATEVSCLVAELTAGAAIIAYSGRYWSFFYDEWGTIAYRRSGVFPAFFAPHNGHLMAVVIAVYRVLFATV